MSTVPAVNPHYKFPECTKLVMADIHAARPIMLTGHTGTGKTTLVQQLGAKANRKVSRVNFNNQCSVSDFIGYNTVIGGSITFIYGALVTAMKNGWWIILDEFDYGPPEIMAFLQSVLEEKATLTLKENGGEVIEAHQDFRIFATANTAGCMDKFRFLYQGANVLNAALLNRFNVYHIEYLKAHDETQTLVGLVNGLPKKLGEQMVKVANMARDAFAREELTSPFSTRQLIAWAKLTMDVAQQLKSDGDLAGVSNAPEIAAGPTIYNKLSPEDSNVMKDIVKRAVYDNKEEN